MKKLLVKNIGLLATPEGKSAHRGSGQGKIKLLKDAWVLIEDGVIASVGTGEAPQPRGRRSSTPRESSSRRVSWTPIRTSFSAAGGRTSWA